MAFSRCTTGSNISRIPSSGKFITISTPNGFCEDIEIEKVVGSYQLFELSIKIAKIWRKKMVFDKNCLPFPNKVLEHLLSTQFVIVLWRRPARNAYLSERRENIYIQINRIFRRLYGYD